MIRQAIPINKIRIYDNVRIEREDGSDKDLFELMQSIKDNGLLQAIGVKEEADGEYLLLWGWRRLQAKQKLQHKTIDAVIWRTESESLSEEEFLIVNTIENIQRSEIGALELGKTCEALKKKGLGNNEIATKLGINPGRVKISLDTFRAIPKKYHSKIKVSGIAARKSGGIGLNLASKIARMRKVTKKQKETVIQKANKGEMSLQDITLLNGMVENNITYDTAIKKMKKYKPITIKMHVSKKQMKKLAVDKSQEEVVKEILNNVHKGLVL